MSENQEIKSKLAKEFAYLESTVEYAAQIAQFGSYSDRNPHLGRMRRCPYCRRRHREALGCVCGARYAKTQRAWSQEEGFHQIELEKPREGELFSKRAQRELLRRSRTRPTNMGYRNSKKIHDLVLEFQGNPSLLANAVQEIQVKTPESSAIPAFAQKYAEWKQKREKRARRRARRARQGA